MHAQSLHTILQLMPVLMPSASVAPQALTYNGSGSESSTFFSSSSNQSQKRKNEDSAVVEANLAKKPAVVVFEEGKQGVKNKNNDKTSETPRPLKRKQVVNQKLPYKRK